MSELPKNPPLGPFTQLFNLQDQVALVTGGGTGIGKMLALGLAAFGARVAVAGRTKGTLQETVQQIEQEGGIASSIVCDIADPESIHAAIKQVVIDHKGLDVVIANAGIIARTPAEEVEADEWRRVIDVNVNGTFFTCQAAAKQMLALGTKGRIISVSSIRALHGHSAGYAAYCTSKGAINMLTRQLACEWGPKGIRINAIAPSITWTATVSKWLANDTAMRESFLSRIPLQNAPDTEDLVGAAVFLASDASRFVTGQVLYVDGGTSAW